MARLGGVCGSDKIWTKIVDTQLYPILAFESHLWDVEKLVVCTTVNRAYRKGIGRDVGMRYQDSLRDRFPDWFREAAEKMHESKVSF